MVFTFRYQGAREGFEEGRSRFGFSFWKIAMVVGGRISERSKAVSRVRPRHGVQWSMKQTSPKLRSAGQVKWRKGESVVPRWWPELMHQRRRRTGVSSKVSGLMNDAKIHSVTGIRKTEEQTEGSRIMGGQSYEKPRQTCPEGNWQYR